MCILCTPRPIPSDYTRTGCTGPGLSLEVGTSPLQYMNGFIPIAWCILHRIEIFNREFTYLNIETAFDNSPSLQADLLGNSRTPTPTPHKYLDVT